MNINIEEELNSDYALKQQREMKQNRLNKQRDRELKKLIIDNISCTEANLFKMAVKFNIMQDEDKVTWIDVDNNPIELTKQELGILINKGASAVEAIYFRYRQLKDEV